MSLFKNNQIVYVEKILKLQKAARTKYVNLARASTQGSSEQLEIGIQKTIYLTSKNNEILRDTLHKICARLVYWKLQNSWN